MEKAAYRIIDANFNRSREAARMMEEYCRFALNSESLSGKAKQIRHEICQTIQELDTDRLIASRDALTDVGREMKVTGQIQRANLQDCFTAACKRLTEALRALAETAQVIDKQISQKFEKLRFETYTLEKEILIFSNITDKFKSVRLYVIITVTHDQNHEEIHKMTQQCIIGGADCIQLRPKAINDRETAKIACEFVKKCKDASVISIINDRVDIAAVSNADGVHLGLDDISSYQGRRLQLKPMIFGASTHSADQLKTAITNGADYVGLGPVFRTPTKPDYEPVGLQYISNAMQMLKNTQIGHAAIGGITLQNINEVLKNGARTVAVSSVVTNAAKPAEMCKKLKEIIMRY